MPTPMQIEPRECGCETQHVIHCGDCDSPARRVRRVPEREQIVVCLAVDRCGHLWRPT